jgi:questin oxidase-like protein
MIISRALETPLAFFGILTIAARKGIAMPAPSYTPLDDALEAISPYGIELRNGNSNHAPMVAEALCAMGRPETVMPWIARYRERMSPRPAATDRIRRDGWRAALGRRDRFGDWSAFFGEELKEAPWPGVLDYWTAKLAPGFCAAATHGVIRVGHAVRSLNSGETPPRLRELADALAGWAATWRELPAGHRFANGAMTPRQAIVKVAIVPPDQRRPGNIVAALGALGDFPNFAPVIGLIDTSDEIGPLLADLTEVFARVYLANANNIQTVIAFIHGVTSLAALGNIAPQLSDATVRAALPYAWQAGCGLYACFGGATAMAHDIAPRDEETGSLIDRAIANGDEHVIKFTEACLSRHALGPSPAYLAAADHVTGIIRRR